VPLLLAFMLLQDLSLDRTDWGALARPWMTAAEAALYDRIGPEDRKKFRGYFIARRLPNPEQWSETGLYLPCFYAPKNYGDIRDLIAYRLGKPAETKPLPQNPELPRLWRYEQHAFGFALDGGGVALDEAGAAAWERVKQAMVVHPEIRYDFTLNTFGRTRLPEDLEFVPAETANAWTVPAEEGSRIHIDVRIPQKIKDFLATTRFDPKQHLEALFFLKRDASERREELPPERVRHAFQRLDLVEAEFASFEAAVPPGRYQAEILIYSGFLPIGMRASATMATLPAELPRIGDPILSQRWTQAGIEVPAYRAIVIGDTVYRSARQYQPAEPARALVYSPYPDTRLWTRAADGATRQVDRLLRRDDWHVFSLPPQSAKVQLLAAAYPKDNDLIAIRATGPSPAWPKDEDARLAQANHPNYFTLEQLELRTDAPAALLFVNGQALLGSTSGRFPWPSLDWGETARLRFELWRDKQRAVAEFQMKRNMVFQQISVKPHFLVAATQGLDGSVEKVDFAVEVAGQKTAIQRTTPYTDIPKLWGLVVNDPLLKSPAWPTVRNAVTGWMQRQLGPEDLFYIVHISHRPEMTLAPTAYKPLARAAVDALHPRAKRENYFTVHYLLEALTHLEEHGTRPHQALLLTHVLTDETQQMENLIPMLRRTGLQLYNLEFPYAFEPESEEKLREPQDDALAVMAAREEEDQREMGAARDYFREDRNVKAGWRLRFKSKTQKRKEREEELRQEAFRDAFNVQLASLTAGLAHTSRSGDPVPSLVRFFERLDRWQKALVHVELSTPYLEEDLVRVKTPEGYGASWTLVTWRPEDGDR